MNKLQTQITFRNYLIPSAITLVLLAISFILHFKSCGSPMGLSHEHWQAKIDLHLNEYPFKIRLLTTHLVVFISSLLNAPYREVFFAIQYVLTAILGPVFYRYLRNLDFSHAASSIGVLLLISSYPILAAHFEPVHTWDDFWVYIFLVLSFSSILKKNLTAGVIFFTLGCFAREQTALFYPILILAAYQLGGEYSKVKRVVLLLIPVLIYGTYYLYVREPYAPHLYFNFATAVRARDTIFSVYIAFGFFWLTGILAVWFAIRKKISSLSPVVRFFVFSTIFSVVVTLVFVLLFGRARETRLLFPPFLFLIPFTITLFRYAMLD